MGLAEWQIDRDAQKMWRVALRYSALGIEMGVAVAIGYGLGWWLDKKYGTAPYLTLTMLLLGIAAGFRGLIRVAQEISKQDAADGNGEDGES